MSNTNHATGMRAITIARDYGSGGGEIARRLATRLEWQLLDHQVVERVAQRLGVNTNEADVYDEHVEDFVTRLFETMRYLAPSIPDSSIITPEELALDSKSYHEALKQVLLASVKLGPGVIVGRGAQIVLASHRDVLHVKVIAPLQERIRYVMQREKLNAAAAQSLIEHKDHERKQELKNFYHANPDDDHPYDLVVNTGVIDLQSAVDLILLALERKAQRLSVPAEELGPGAGLASYPNVSQVTALR